MNKAELLLPAGNMEKLEVVFKYGADAAYLGGEMFNLRAFAGNFNQDELRKAVEYSHSLGKKIYVTLNVIPHNEEMDQLPEYVRFLETIGVDGVIVADLGVFQIVKENSNLNISVSTQASNTNWRSVKNVAISRCKKSCIGKGVIFRRDKRDKRESAGDRNRNVHSRGYVYFYIRKMSIK